MSVPLVVSERSLHAAGMPEKAQRRRFSAAYKQKILREAARCTQPGEMGALLRREGLYSSHLAGWRAAAARRGHLREPVPRRGPPKRAPAPQTARIQQLERQVAAAVRRAERAEALVEVQKKVAALWEIFPLPTGPS